MAKKCDISLRSFYCSSHKGGEYWNDIHQVVCHLTSTFYLSPSPEKMPNVIFALTQHGGHLGFFEGAVLFPQPLTWMDKVIVEYTDAICHWERSRPACQRSSQRDVNSCLQSPRVTLNG